MTHVGASTLSLILLVIGVAGFIGATLIGIGSSASCTAGYRRTFVTSAAVLLLATFLAFLISHATRTQTQRAA